jgi:hypothetical protein
MQADPWHFVSIFLALLLAIFVLKKVFRIIALLIIGLVGFLLMTGELPDLGF